jgi:hypothetical protein
MAPTDFLVMSPHAVDASLVECRQRLNERRPPEAQVGSDWVTVLAVLDGAAEHKQHHRNCDFHYQEFTRACRHTLAEHRGAVLPADLDGLVDYVACAWFHPTAVTGALAAACDLHRYFRKANDLYRPVWFHERHALVGIGQDEHAAFRLAQMATRDQTLVDPALWQALTPEARLFAGLAEAGPPDFRRRAAEIERTVAENVEAARIRLTRRRVRLAPVGVRG